VGGHDHPLGASALGAAEVGKLTEKRIQGFRLGITQMRRLDLGGQRA
jgi:hypothetical protein